MATFQRSGKKEPPEQEGLSSEKLMEKYKSALSIAQKAKTARDEAIGNNKLILGENEKLKEKIKTLEKRYNTAEEMLAALTDQKLKLAMEIDDLKKEKAIYFNELKTKQNAEIEAESFKRLYDRLLKENEDLVEKFGSSGSKGSHSQDDFSKIIKENESLNKVCSELKAEKAAFKTKLLELEENQKRLESVLSQKFNLVVSEFKEWAPIINAQADFSKMRDLISENDTLKTEKEKDSTLISSLSKEKHNLEQELSDVNERLIAVRIELEVANTDRDQMVNSLEKVNSETKHLIDNCERLTDEIDMLKEEKMHSELIFTSLSNEKKTFSKSIEEKDNEICKLSETIEELTSQIKRNSAMEVTFLKNDSTTMTEKCLQEEEPEKFTAGQTDFIKEESIEKERSVNSELNQLQEELQKFSCGIERYKRIAEESQLQLEKSMTEITEQNVLLNEQAAEIQMLSLKVSEFEELKKNFNDNLTNCKSQLLYALDELSTAEKIRNQLKNENDDKELAISNLLRELSDKNDLINQSTECVQIIKEELSLKEALCDSEKEGDSVNKIPLKSNALISLVDHLNDLKYFIYKVVTASAQKLQKIQQEIDSLKVNITEYKEHNETLKSDNTSLNKHIKDLLNEQTNDNNELVSKLVHVQETFSQQVKEKQNIITELEKEMQIVKPEVQRQIDLNKNITEENAELKTEISNLISKQLNESAEFAKKMQSESADLQMQSDYAIKMSKDDLKSEIHSLKKTQYELEIMNQNISKENIILLRKLKQSINDIEKLKDVDILISNNLILSSTNNELNTELAVLKEETSILYQVNKNAKTSIKNEIEEKMSLIDKLNHLTNETADKSISLSHLESTLLSHKEQNSSLEIENDNIKERISELVHCKDENHLLRNRLSKNQIKFKQMSEEITVLKGEKNRLSVEVEQSAQNESQTIVDLQTKISDLQQEIKNIGDDNLSLTKKNNELSNEIIHLNDSIKKLQLLNEKKESELKLEIDENHSEIENLNKILLETNKNVANLSQLENEFAKEKLNTNESYTKLLSLQEENCILNEKIKMTTAETENLIKQISSLNADMKQKCQKITQLKEQINDLEEQVRDLTLTNQNFKEIVETLRSNQVEEKNFLATQNNKVHTELNNCKELLDFKTKELKENNRIWAGRFTSLKMALNGLDKGRKEIKNNFQNIESVFILFMDQIKEPLEEKVNVVVQNAVSAAKHELITEMHQMNQALKERGEVISKLEFTLSEYQTNTKELTKANVNVQTELESIQNDLKLQKDKLFERELYIRQLESENEQIKESHDSTTDTDVLSTSTISKTEEHSRLRDVEDSFEDRYAKLKLLALKLKKRASDLAQTLETERNKMSAEKADLQEKISNMSMAVKNAQKLQELFDHSQDELDDLKGKNKMLEDKLEVFKNTGVDFKNKITALESGNQSIPVMKKHIDSLNGVIKASKSDIARLQMESKAEIIKYEELKKTSSKLEAKIQELTRLLEQAKAQGKNSNVLELEMKNYEKIIADMSSQLNIEKSTVKSLQSENEALSNTKVGLEEQIAILEKQIIVEEERSMHTNEQLNGCRVKINEYNSQIESLNNKILDIQKEFGNEKRKTEALTLEMSSATSEFSKKEIAMVSKIGSLQEQIRCLETSLVVTKQELDTSKCELSRLNEEFESYKLRAQTILAKRKGDFVTHAEKEAREQADRLKQECQILEEKLEAYVSEIESLNTRMSSLILEKTRSDKKSDEIRLALQEKLTEYDTLSSEFYNFKRMNEAVVENLQTELSKKKSDYQTELSHYKKIIDEMNEEFKQKEESLQTADKNKDKAKNIAYSISPSEYGPLPSEREDGEGSESVPSPKMRRYSSLVPLDILLNNPIPDENRVSLLQEQVDKLRRELTSYDVRSRHLSSLLSEAEKDSARNLHQNKILKEEVRRLERSLERQPHVANTEYLKNVVLKFVTLPIGDERTRLLPVLDTLLKLSPEEIHKLNSVAKGDSQAGWGTYLQSWTGL